MSSGGGFAPSQGSSNVSTNSTPTTSQTAPAPSGGKGGYNNSPMKMEDFAQQQPQVYMPPAQPTFYDQAFTNSYYNPGFQRPRMDYGLGGMGNAYARRAQFRSQSSPFDAPKPPGEMQYSGQYAPQAPAGLQNNPDYVPPYAGPTSQMPQYGGPGAAVGQGPPRLEPSPAAATRGVASDNINNPAYQQQMAASNMTDYQRLMQRKNSASAGPYVNPLTGEVGGVNPFAQVSDLEIANSLGYKDPSADMVPDIRPRMPFDANLGLQGLRQQMAAAGTLGQSSQNEKAKEYLNSIGYGQAGFDASKYEAKRQPVSTGPRTGLGALLGGY